MGSAKTPPISFSGIAARRASCRDDHAYNFIRHLHDVSFLDELQENSLQGGLADVFANLAGRSLGNHLAFPENNQVGTHFLDDLKNMRAIEDGFPSRTQGLNQILDDEDGSYVEAGQRLIENENLGPVWADPSRGSGYSFDTAETRKFHELMKSGLSLPGVGVPQALRETYCGT